MPEALFASGGPCEIRTRYRRMHDALLPGFDNATANIVVNRMPDGQVLRV